MFGENKNLNIFSTKYINLKHTYTKLYIFYKDTQHLRIHYPIQNGYLCIQKQNKRWDHRRNG